MDPTVWGPHMWKTIHAIALGYPDRPSNIDRENYRVFFMNLYKIIPCQTCADHYQEIVAKLPVDSHLNNQHHLFEWTWNIHNQVNMLLNKPLMSLEDAKNMFINAYESHASSLRPNRESSSSCDQHGYIIAFGVLLLIVIVGIAAYKSSFKIKGRG